MPCLDSTSLSVLLLGVMKVDNEVNAPRSAVMTIFAFENGLRTKSEVMLHLDITAGSNLDHQVWTSDENTTIPTTTHRAKSKSMGPGGNTKLLLGGIRPRGSD